MTEIFNSGGKKHTDGLNENWLKKGTLVSVIKLKAYLIFGLSYSPVNHLLKMRMCFFFSPLE